MNQREMQRVTTPSLPISGDNLLTVISKISNGFKEIFRRDGNKEQRIRILEEALSKGTGKWSLDKYFGENWRIINFEDGTGNLYVQNTVDKGVTWNTKYTFTP